MPGLVTAIAKTVMPQYESHINRFGVTGLFPIAEAKKPPLIKITAMGKSILIINS